MRSQPQTSRAKPASASRPGQRPRHLTISGDLGSGKSAVAAGLAERLGFEVVSTGAIQRRIAASLSLTTLEANLLAEQDTSIDDQIDSGTVELAAQATAPIIFDSRMAWHFVPGAFKVRLIVDPVVAAERIIGRGPATVEAYASVDEALTGVLERAASEVRRFKDRYGVYITSPDNFDLITDTTDLTITQAVTQIAAAYWAAAG